MPFFDKLTSIAQSAVDNTKDMFEVNKLNSAISAEKAKITELKAKIGDYYYAKYASGAALDDEPAGIAAQIKAHEDKITSVEAEIQAKKEEAQRTEAAAKNPQALPAISVETIACPACGASNPSSSKFCRECGGKLAAPAVEKQLFCTACGAQNPAGTKFCGECGNWLDI